ncbi:MAG: family 20 glycosylhydrolase [Aestuariibaculum sp.]
MLKNIIKCLLFFLMLISCQTNNKKIFTESDITIIPKPSSVVLKEGGFYFNKDTRLLFNSSGQEMVAKIFQQKLKTSSGLLLDIIEGGEEQDNAVIFKTDTSLANEAYKLTATNKGVVISSNGNAGFLYGVQTLIQLLPVEIESAVLQSNIDWVIPNIEIRDKPRFSWRGLMLDVSRHFFDKDYVLKTIDRLAAHKMNVLHFHLIDDQGWRLQIKKYPKLTEVGAWRTDKEDLDWKSRDVVREHDTLKYGGFYTQDDIKEIVAYAASKQIEVIPEIEMPAHVTSAIAAYPEFSCKNVPIEVPSGGLWPITDIYCPGKEETFLFLEDVLTEVMALFPSKYIHIGGDEATRTNWETCNNCKKRMYTEHIENVKELQSYFIKRIEKFINSKGRKLIGWDEILEGGLAPDATVMSWRGFDGGLEAAKAGHDVIMTPEKYCYINQYQGPYDVEPKAQIGYLPLNKIYQFDPVHETMTVSEAQHVLGGQANLWAEYVPTASHSEYMIFPRLAAMSECLWSDKENKDWTNFSSRLTAMLKRYDKQGINYSKSAFIISGETTAETNATEKIIRLTLNNEFPESDIRYVLNSDDLKANATIYTKPIALHETTTVTASLFKDNRPIGVPFKKIIKFHKGMNANVTYLTKPYEKYSGAGTVNLVDGLRGSKNFHDGKWQGWIDNDMEVVLDLNKKTKVNSVSVGVLESQGPDIYYPVNIEVSTSNNGKAFTRQATLNRAYRANPDSDLAEFKLDFNAEIETSFIKVKVKALPENPEPNRGVWLFVDEIIVD